MNNYFTYRLLKYQYSAILGETFNIGLLLSLPNQESYFIYPKRLHRLKNIYPDVEELHILYYLKGFKERIDKINKLDKGGLVFTNGEEDYLTKVSSELIANDDSALQFGKILKSTLYTEDINKIIEHLHNKYFFPYEKIGEDIPKNDEEYLLKTVKDQLKSKNDDIYTEFFSNKPSKTISNKRTSLEVKLYWKNGATHLIQPIGFDLERPHSIDNKANRFFGKFFLLKDALEKENATVDAIVSRPRDKKLFSAYDKALDILQEAPCEIFEEVQLAEYTERMIKELESHLDM